MDELKSCPFCGGKAKFQRFANPQNFFCIRCTVCGSETDGYRLNRTNATEDENMAANAAAWNRRPAQENISLTNGDIIRSMTNEELAVTLMCPNEMGMAEIECDHSDDKNCCNCLLSWLNQPEETE